jgi:uncharacterized protein
MLTSYQIFRIESQIRDKSEVAPAKYAIMSSPDGMEEMILIIHSKQLDAFFVILLDCKTIWTANMNNFNNSQNPFQSNGGAGNPYAQGNRQWDYRDVNAPAMAPGKTANAFLTRVFTVMSLGLAITGLVAWLFATKYLMVGENLISYYSNPIHWVVDFSPLIFILVLSFGIHRLSYATATLIFAAFATMMGLSMASIFVLFSMGTIFKVFFLTSGTFAAMAVIGAFTSVDLTRMGTILMYAVIGLMIAMIVNWLMASPMMDYVISCAGVVIFAGLTAYNTQNMLRLGYNVEHGSESANKLALMGALTLYMNFINLFMFLLRIFGGGRN